MRILALIEAALCLLVIGTYLISTAEPATHGLDGRLVLGTAVLLVASVLPAVLLA